MLEELHDLLTTQNYTTRPALLAAGYSDDDICALKKHGRLFTIGPGLYVGPHFQQLKHEDQHIIRCHASLSRLEGRVALSHQSAALLYGATVWNADLSQVQVTRLDNGRGRRQAGVTHHVSEISVRETTSVRGLLTTSPARTVWDIATTSPTEQGLVIIDSLMHLGLVDTDCLRECIDKYGTWKGSRRARIALSLSNGLAESPGETRSRYLFQQGGLPKPQLQFRVEDGRGQVIGRTDFAWPEFRLLGEFDGKIKYGDSVDLVKEKTREDRLRAQGWGMVRLVWNDLAGPQRAATIARVRAALDESKRLYG